MKHIFIIFITLFIFRDCFGINNSKNAQESANQTLVDICIFLELSLGPELNMIENGRVGAILEEFIKAIEQEMIIITSSILLHYLKIVLTKNWQNYATIKNQINHYEIFQTREANFCLLLPHNKKLITLSHLGFSSDLKQVNSLDNCTCSLNDGINLNELEGIFCHSNIQRTIYLTGHGIKAQDNNHVVASLTFTQYRDLINFLNCLNCKFLFVSSCYAAGLPMIKLHKEMAHTYPIVMGNLTDNISLFHPKINFKKYFMLLHEALRHIKHEEWHYSDLLKRAIRKISGTNIHNIPWLKLPNVEEFFLLNSNQNNVIIDESKFALNRSTLEINNAQHILVASTTISKKLTIQSSKLPKIIPMIPGPSHHVFHYVETPHHTFYDLVNCIFQVHHVYRKVFFFKKLKIKKPKRKLQKFKIIKIKNVLLVNHGIQEQISNNNIFKNHELYYQRKNSYYRMEIPVGIKLGYVEITPELVSLSSQDSIIDNFLQLSKPNCEIVNSIKA